MGEFVTVSIDDHRVATIRVHRPPVNALSPQVFDELGEAARQIGQDAEVAAAVLWGGPEVFAAGADVKALAALSFHEAVERAGAMQDALTALARMPKILVAAINGYALGGGCELALTADFRYAAEDVQMGVPEILLGLIPGAGGTQRLQRLVGQQKAKEMVYGGSFYTASACLDMGLVDRVFVAGDVYDNAVEAARRYADGPFALRLAKQAITEGAELELDAALRLETSLFASCFGTEDARSGMAAFVERGPGRASFTGR